MDIESYYFGPEYRYFLERSVQIIGVEVNEGQSKDGPEIAPRKLREANLIRVLKELGWSVRDLGNITNDDLEIELPNSTNDYVYKDIKNSLEIGALCKQLHQTTKKMAEENSFALVLGGDHGLATGSISGVKSVYPDLKVIWVDAHADANTPETSPSGNYHGMPVAHLFGWLEEGTVPGFDWFKPCLKPEEIVYIGLRDVDPEEKYKLRKYGIKAFDMHQVDKCGIGSVVDQALKYLDPESKGLPIYVSFDVDSVDPTHVYGTGTKARYGLTDREGLYILREVANTGNLVGTEIVEINPLLEKESNREDFFGDNPLVKGPPTVCYGVDLICAALGKTWC